MISRACTRTFKNAESVLFAKTGVAPHLGATTVHVQYPIKVVPCDDPSIPKKLAYITVLHNNPSRGLK